MLEATDQESLSNNECSRGDTWISLRRRNRISFVVDWESVEIGAGGIRWERRADEESSWGDKRNGGARRGQCGNLVQCKIPGTYEGDLSRTPRNEGYGA